MSTYKAYPTKATMPRRLARKNARREIFVTNSKAAKLRRKAARLERKSQEIE